MDQKILRRILIVALVFTCISAANNITNLKSLDEVKLIYIVRLLTLGIGIGASLVSIIMLIISRKRFNR